MSKEGVKSATVLGATGLVGSILLEKLLNSDRIKHVQVLGRSSVELSNPKLEEHLGDLTKLEFYADKEATDYVFVCIGTTRSKTPDMNTYKKIDLGIPLNAAKWAASSKSEKIVLVSAMGADPKSRIFYNRIKGNMEQEVSKTNIETVIFVRPSLIIGNRNEFRLGERIGIVLAKVFSFLIPAKYKGIKASDIAEAMYKLAFNAEKGRMIVESDALQEQAKK